MTIAIVVNDVIEAIGEYNILFPYTSFPEGGPSDEWLAENNCKTVIVSLPYNPDTQELVGVPPYLLNDNVYVVEVVDLTPEQIAERQAAALKAKREAMIVTPYQAKVVLLQEGSLDEVEAAVSTSTDPLVKLAWTNAIQYQRLSPLVTEIATQLGWSDEDLDLLFEAAAQVQ